jgi:HAD superfamily hydrolase (TIGR01509 family)
MLARLEVDLKPVAGVADALARIDVPRCVASSSDRARIQMTLRWTGLAAFFGDHIFSGVDVAQGKPAPDLFLLAAKAMGFAPADCIVIEDSTLGVQAGVAASMPVIGFTGGSHTDPGHASRLSAAGAGTIVTAMADLPAALGMPRHAALAR